MMKLPDNIAALVKAQNDRNSTAFAACFTKEATVSDDGSSYSGPTEIRQWIQQAMERYTMHLKPVDFNQTESGGKLTVEVTGSFKGSPAIMQYHLELEGTAISSLRITG